MSTPSAPDRGGLTSWPKYIDGGASSPPTAPPAGWNRKIPEYTPAMHGGTSGPNTIPASLGPRNTGALMLLDGITQSPGPVTLAPLRKSSNELDRVGTVVAECLQSADEAGAQRFAQGADQAGRALFDVEDQDHTAALRGVQRERAGRNPDVLTILGIRAAELVEQRDQVDRHSVAVDGAARFDQQSAIGTASADVAHFIVDWLLMLGVFLRGVFVGCVLSVGMAYGGGGCHITFPVSSGWRQNSRTLGAFPVPIDHTNVIVWPFRM